MNGYALPNIQKAATKITAREKKRLGLNKGEKEGGYHNGP